MTHNEVYKHIPFWFVFFNKEDIDVWFPSGYNAIRIRLKNQAEFIFQYNTEKDWSIETVKSYINRMPKGDKKNV